MQRDEPEEALEHTVDELEERTERLGEHIDEARDLAKDRAEEARGPGAGGEVAGDWQGTDDQAGGEDPVGAAEERDEAAEDSSSRDERGESGA
jgi:hypothetical protein